MAKARVGGGEDLEKRLKGLKLTEEELSGVKGTWSTDEKEQGLVPQAVGKLFSGKPGYVEGMVRTLGRIWCPTKGIRCKELGDNLFLFSFLQPGGKRRAITEGPWEFGGDLLIVVDFDGSKRLKDLEFIYAPMWIRIFDLPLGMMNAETGKAIGDKVGKVLEVDTEADGSAVGGYLRVKVRVDVRKPLLRGVTLEHNVEGQKLWCPIRYEFLPNFCYACGMLGHLEKECDDSVGKQDGKQFGDWLRASPTRSRAAEGGGLGSERALGSSDSWGRSSAKNSSRQITNSRKDSSRSEPELHGEGSGSLKEQENLQKCGEPCNLISGKEEDPKKVEKEKTKNAENEKQSENKFPSMESGHREGEEDLNDGSVGDRKKGGVALDQTAQNDILGEEMDMDSNLAGAATSTDGDDNQDGVKASKRKRIRFFTRLSHPQKSTNDVLYKQKNKKRLLEEEGEVGGEVQKKMRKQTGAIEEIDMGIDHFTAGLHEQPRREQ